MFYFVFDGTFPSTSPRGAYIWKGDLTEGQFCVNDLGGLYLEGLIFGILRYLFLEPSLSIRPSYGVRGEETQATSSQASWAIDSEPIRARGIIVKYTFLLYGEECFTGN